MSLSQPSPGDGGNPPPERAAPPGTAASPAAVAPTTTASLPPAPAPGRDDEPMKMNAVLKANSLGIHKLKVGQLQATEYTRQISKSGLTVVMDSIKRKGWSESSLPYVLVPREQLPDGRQTVWTPEVLSKLSVFVLDGNHRLAALTHLHGLEFEIDCWCFLHFDDDVIVNSLARSTNVITSEAVAVTTTFDRIFSCKKAMEAIMKGQHMDDAAKVTASMLADAYLKGGDTPPSNPLLCQNKRLVLGMKAPAFFALKEASESDDKNVDVASLSKNLLDADAALKFPRGKDVEQGYLIHILSRFKANDPGKKAPVKSDLPKLRQRALDAGDYRDLVSRTIPYESWSPSFHEVFFGTVYGRVADWETWGSGYMKARQEEVDHLAGMLRRECKLTEDHIGIIKSKLSSRLAKAAAKTPDLKPFLEAWDKKRAAVDVFITEHNKGDDDSDEGSYSNPSSSDDESEPEATKPRFCSDCDPEIFPEKFECTECGILHRYSCSLCEETGEGDPRAVKCIACPEVSDSDQDGPARKKRKKVDKTPLPPDDNAIIDTSMSRNTIVYADPIFGARAKEYQGASPMKTNAAPKLAIVDLTSEKSLFKRTDTSKRNLKLVLEAVLLAMDQKGTIACAIPRPWHEGLPRVADAFTDMEAAEVEASPLLITYESVSGGAQPKKTEAHLRNQSEQVLIIHRTRTAGVDFTCNRRVVTTDVFGHSQGVIPHAKQILSLQSLPAGAPNGGSRSFFPPKSSQFLVARYTNAGDTVLGIGVETTTVAEDAIGRGRRVEFHVLDNSKRAPLQTKIKEAFHKAHSSGMFQSRLGGGAVVVGPTCLPTGLPQSTVPTRVSESLKAELAKGQDALTASFTVAQMLAKTTHLALTGDLRNAILAVKKRKSSTRSSSREVSDVLLWGELVVYPSPKDAKASMNQDELDEQFVRVIQVATHAQLEIMLEPGTERCGPDAALYLRVDATSPGFWVRWETNRSKADLEVCCDIPQRGSRASVLKKVSFDAGGGGGVKLRHVRNKPSALGSSSSSSSSDKSLFVSTDGGRIVGAPNFGTTSDNQEDD